MNCMSCPDLSMYNKDLPLSDIPLHGRRDIPRWVARLETTPPFFLLACTALVPLLLTHAASRTPLPPPPPSLFHHPQLMAPAALPPFHRAAHLDLVLSNHTVADDHFGTTSSSPAPPSRHLPPTLPPRPTHLPLPTNPLLHPQMSEPPLGTLTTGLRRLFFFFLSSRARMGRASSQTRDPSRV